MRKEGKEEGEYDHQMGPELDGDYTLLMNFFIIINIISKYTMHMYIYRVRVCSLTSYNYYRSDLFIYTRVYKKT